MQDLDEVGAAAVDYLYYSGYAALAFCWALMARSADEAIRAGSTDPFHAGKIAVADFFFSRVLPRAKAHQAAIEAGKGTLMDVDEGALVAL